MNGLAIWVFDSRKWCTRLRRLLLTWHWKKGVRLWQARSYNRGAGIGAGTIVNTRASVDHDCLVGRFVHIAPGATLSGGVRLDDGCHIGVGATVVQNITIGGGALVTAGAVVTSDVKPNERYGGANG